MNIKLNIVFLIAISSLCTQHIFASDELSQQIIALDKQLYTDSVACDKAALSSIYDKNVEIYDGKNGLLSLNDLFSSQYVESCEKYKVQPVLDSLSVYPLNNFGAILTGNQHQQKKQGAAYKTTSANQYIHVYKQDHNEWKISRVFTYDFKSAKSKSHREDERLYNKIADLDKAVFDSYNACDIERHKIFFTDDLEFYHDKGGLTSSLKSFIENTEKYICAKDRAKIRRELVTGTFKVYPMNNYGAISVGEHKFYQTEPGQKERVTAIAKFVCLWKKVDGQWKMSRALSYEHKSLE